jgi:hypothetical protein
VRQISLGGRRHKRQLIEVVRNSCCDVLRNWSGRVRRIRRALRDLVEQMSKCVFRMAANAPRQTPNLFYFMHVRLKPFQCSRLTDRSTEMTTYHSPYRITPGTLHHNSFNRQTVIRLADVPLAELINCLRGITGIF